MSAGFEKAVDDINNRVAKTLSDAEMLEIYGLYKQATVGDVNIGKPGGIDIKVCRQWNRFISKFDKYFRARRSGTRGTGGRGCRRRPRRRRTSRSPPR